MGYWHSRGLRGSYLEECINQTNKIYLEQGLAAVSYTQLDVYKRQGLSTPNRDP